MSENIPRFRGTTILSVRKGKQVALGGDGQVTVRLRGDEESGGDRLTISRRHLAEVRRRLKGKPD